ncbi:MAG: hypothetical protein K6E97_00940 [Treponema sp.]|nr:hypothetical protein [Treponema sp.]
MTVNDLANEIYKKYGTITRARECFLYTKKAIRLTDLFQEDGRAILGWRGNEAFTYLKNTLSKGLTGSFITEQSSRVNKAVNLLLNSKKNVFYFSSKSEALKECLKISPDNTSLYRPWNQENLDWSKTDCVIIAPPFPWTDTIYIAAVPTDADKINSIKIPFALENAIARSIYNLIKALQEREEKDWFIYDTILTKYFNRKGPYLFTKVSQNRYDDFIMHCLECEIIINPDYNKPSIVPFGADKGVFTKLKNNPFKI